MNKKSILKKEDFKVFVGNKQIKVTKAEYNPLTDSYYLEYE